MRAIDAIVRTNILLVVLWLLVPVVVMGAVLLL